MSIRNIFLAVVLGFSCNAWAMESGNDTTITVDVETAIDSISGTDLITTGR